MENPDEKENGGTRIDVQMDKSRFVRILTQDKTLPEIEGEIVRAVGEGVRVLMSTREGLSRLETGSDSRNAAIAVWAEGLSQKHGLDWQRVGRDVLFRTVR